MLTRILRVVSVKNLEVPLPIPLLRTHLLHLVILISIARKIYLRLLRPRPQHLLLRIKVLASADVADADAGVVALIGLLAARQPSVYLEESSCG